MNSLSSISVFDREGAKTSLSSLDEVNKGKVKGYL